MEKYEKIEFDMNTIDSAFKISYSEEWNLFWSCRHVSVTGKTYLPIFINETLSDIYGDNKLGKVKENIKANKSSGFKGNQQLLAL
jgi:hypothetical protein